MDLDQAVNVDRGNPREALTELCEQLRHAQTVADVAIAAGIVLELLSVVS